MENKITVVEKPKDILIDEDGQLLGKTLGEQMRIAKYYIASDLLPRGINTPEKALIAIQYCRALGLKPAIALRQICVINGIPTIYGDLPLAVVRRSKKLEYIKESIIDKDGLEINSTNKNLLSNPFGAICKLKRVDSKEEVERFFTIRDAERACLLGSTCWKKYPKDMLKYRARGQAIKDTFSDILSGAAIAEYDFGILPEKEINKSFDSKVDDEATNHFLEVK